MISPAMRARRLRRVRRLCAGTGSLRVVELGCRNAEAAERQWSSRRRRRARLMRFLDAYPLDR